MGFFRSMDISASGLTAQRVRMDIIAQNIANAQTTRTAEGTPYRRKTVELQAMGGGKTFADVYNDSLNASAGAGVRASAIRDDMSDFKLVYDPTHADAGADGYVRMPNVDLATEMIDMITASRAYEANVTALDAMKSMASKALEIGK